ncbi:hypothetical protein TWF696_009256 [Orbilia brochopaga]|uniref:AB hydrolase-1 domain-containing protein n=1 Tax=Orbilia brochopaga TaxID=3140254 RepID=A0AAV9UI61_9PEZI
MSAVISSSSRAASRLSRNLLHSSVRPPTTHLRALSSPSSFSTSNITNSRFTSLHRLSVFQTARSPYSTIISSPTTHKSSQNAAKIPPPPEEELQTLTLPTGRNITYRCYGPSDGKPLFYFHGTPGGASESAAFKPFIYSRNIRIIGTSRPGFGQSDMHPGRTLCDHAHDVLAIADSLGIDKFKVMGASGGGPYSLACAKVISPDRLKGCAVVAGVTPWHLGREGMNLQGWIRFMFARYLYWLQGPIVRWHWNHYVKGKGPEVLENIFRRELEFIGRSLGPKDKEALANEEVVNAEIVAFHEAYERGFEGAVIDGRAVIGDWDFRVEDIPYEGIKLYYGTEDKATPVYGARKMQKLLKNATLTEYEGEGHWSIFMNQGGDIFSDFMKD